jgi:hypothetical protein
LSTRHKVRPQPNKPLKLTAAGFSQSGRFSPHRSW